MKLEVKERYPRECYDELLYVVSFLKYFRKKPETKVERVTEHLQKYSLYSALAFSLFLVFNMIFKNIIFLIMAVLAVLIGIYAYMTKKDSEKQIDAFLNEAGNRTYEINDEGITYSSDTKMVKLPWENIEMILKGKYAFCFVPSSNTDFIICISRQYEDEVMQGIKEAGKEKLIRG